MKAKKFETLAQTENYNKTLEDLYSLIAEYYFNILSTEKDLQTYEDEIQINYKRLDDIQKQSSSSRARKTDLYATQAQIYSLESQKANIASVLKSYRSGLFILSGIPATEVLENDVEIDWTPKPLSFYLEKINSSHKVRQSEFQLEAAEAELTYAKNEYLPKVGLGANYYFQRPGINADIHWDVSLTLSMPIYSGGETSSKISSLRSAKMSKYELVRKEKFQIQDTISSTYEKYVGAIDQHLKLKKAVESSTKAMTTSRRDYIAGLINNSEYQRVLADHFNYVRNLARVEQSAALLFLKLNITSQRKEIPFKKSTLEAAHDL